MDRLVSTGIIIENSLQFASVISPSRGSANKLLNTQTCFTCVIFSCPYYPQQLGLSPVVTSFSAAWKDCPSHFFVFLPELPERKICAKWMFSYLKKPCNFTWSSFPVMLWKKRLAVLGERKIKWVAAFIFCTNDALFMCSYLLVWFWKIIKPEHLSLFWLMIHILKYLLALSLYQLYWVNCYVFYYCLNFKTIQFWDLIPHFIAHQQTLVGYLCWS